MPTMQSLFSVRAWPPRRMQAKCATIVGDWEEPSGESRLIHFEVIAQIELLETKLKERIGFYHRAFLLSARRSLNQPKHRHMAIRVLATVSPPYSSSPRVKIGLHV